MRRFSTNTLTWHELHAAACAVQYVEPLVAVMRRTRIMPQGLVAFGLNLMQSTLCNDSGWLIETASVLVNWWPLWCSLAF